MQGIDTVSFQRHFRVIINACHEISLTKHADAVLDKLSTWTHIKVVNFLLAWADNPKMKYSGKIQIPEQKEFVQNP